LVNAFISIYRKEEGRERRMKELKEERKEGMKD